MLARIKAALAEQFPAHVQAGSLGFVPHLTVGFFDSLAAMAQAKTTIAATWQSAPVPGADLCATPRCTTTGSGAPVMGCRWASGSRADDR